ncbi:MAG: hypothetical protein JO211_01925 [Acidobacteriaceae bacterium]|nr:hypothetical protein [Acidobacteriaceae bacterium]
MNHLERVSSIVGTLLIGIAAFLIVSERGVHRARHSKQPPVGELAEELKQAWAGYHNR